LILKYDEQFRLCDAVPEKFKKLKDGISSTLRENLVTWDPQKRLVVNNESCFGGLFNFGYLAYNQNRLGVAESNTTFTIKSSLLTSKVGASSPFPSYASEKRRL
jgi:hypothetical protein